jgi:hypothetical protein
VKFTEDLPFADPEAAARKLLDIVRASIAQSGPPYACTGATDTDFLRAGGSVDEYSAGMKSAAAQKWLEINRFGNGGRNRLQRRSVTRLQLFDGWREGSE